MRHVLILTLGPVQDFIAAGRRSRDLWFGSWLLSELSKAIAAEVALHCGEESLVFPGVPLSELAPEGDTMVANKVVIRVPDGQSPTEVATLAGGAMRKRLEQKRAEAFQMIQDGLDGREYFETAPAEAQIADLIEMIWASAPETDGYKVARERAEDLLAARKNTRIWKPVTWGKDVPKSSIDGARESVLHEDLYEAVQEKKISAEEVRRRYGVQAGERLCGVGLLKRHGRRGTSRYGHRFLSTGHLAAWPVLERLDELAGSTESLKASGDYRSTLLELGAELEELQIPRDRIGQHQIFGPYDGSLLFEGRLPDLFELVADPEDRRSRIVRARKALSAFLGKIGISTPLPYYAILLGDGDHMGKVIDSQETFEDHRQLSQELGRFAKEVRSVVETQHGGELIYSGGDDVLAFVPLHKVIDCARSLARSFREKLGRFATADGTKPSLSVGIGISHFMDPLQEALALAREAESLAKVQRGSLAVIVDKRSGPAIRVTGPWGTVDQDLDDFTLMHENDLVPDGAVYELEDLARLVQGASGAERDQLEQLVKKEAARILRRKQPEQGAKSGMEKKDFDRIMGSLDRLPLDEVARLLIVARLFAQASRQAKPLKPGERP